MAQDRARTELEAANLALSHLRQPDIGSLDESSHRARQVKKHFGTVRDDLLRATDWNFATAYVVPAQDATASLGELENRFPLPPDCVKVRYVRDDSGRLEADEWAVESGTTVDSVNVTVEATFLVTDSPSPTVCYTRRVTDVSLWDATFVRAFKLALAAAIGPSVARSSSAAEKADAAADVVTDRAAIRDAREKAPSQVSRETSWVRARRGWRGASSWMRR